MTSYMQQSGFMNKVLLRLMQRLYLIDYRIIECKINKSRWIIMYFCTTK